MAEPISEVKVTEKMPGVVPKSGKLWVSSHLRNGSYSQIADLSCAWPFDHQEFSFCRWSKIYFPDTGKLHMTNTSCITSKFQHLRHGDPFLTVRWYHDSAVKYIFSTLWYPSIFSPLEVTLIVCQCIGCALFAEEAKMESTNTLFQQFFVVVSSVAIKVHLISFSRLPWFLGLVFLKHYR